MQLSGKYDYRSLGMKMPLMGCDPAIPLALAVMQ